MPDNIDTSDNREIAQRGRGRNIQQNFPRRIPRRRGPGFPQGFPQVFPTRQRFPGPLIIPFYFGTPPSRCYYIDRYGRCCDRSGWCCDRFGRCGYGDYGNAGPGWYGASAGWDTMDEMDYDDPDYE